MDYKIAQLIVMLAQATFRSCWGFCTYVDIQLTYNKHEPFIRSGGNEQRKIIWYNPPFSRNVETNIGQIFLRLIQKHFLKSHNFHYIFNKNCHNKLQLYGVQYIHTRTRAHTHTHTFWNVNFVENVIVSC